MKFLAKYLFLCTAIIIGFSFSPTAYKSLEQRYKNQIPKVEAELLYDQDKTDLRNYMAKYSVRIDSLEGMGHGSGFQITHEGTNYILTNKHVCEMAINDRIGVMYYDSEFTFNAQVLKRSKEHDLCLVEAPSQYVKSGLQLAKNIKMGDYVAVFGYPYDLPATFSDGMYSGDVILEWVDDYTEDCAGEEQLRVGFDFSNPANPFVEELVCVTELLSGVVTSTIYPGNSGSPVVNKDGEIVGVAYAGRSGVIFANYMVPLSFIQNFIKEI